MFGLKYLVCFVSVLCGLHLTAMAAEEERSVSDYLLPVVELLSRGDPALMPAGGNEVEVITDGRMLWERMLQDIRNARRSIRIEYYRWAPDEAGDQIREAAERGVDVRILLPKEVDEPFMKLANESFYEECLEKPVKIYEYTPRFDHTKMVLCDRNLSLLGSTNLDYLSLLINYEIAALVCDAALTEKLSSDFLRLLDDAEEITLEGARAAFRQDKHDRSFWHSLRKRL